jgi:hypothetical protein
MIRLNPQQWPDKAVTCNLFPPEDDYFTQLFAKKYREFLETNATNDEGMQMLQDIMVLKHNGNHTWMALVETTMPKITTSYYTSSKL